MTLKFATDTAQGKDVLEHLLACDGQFEPPLSSRVDLAAYSDKLALKASTFEAWSEGRLVGLVATYCTHPEVGSAHVSNVSVLAGYTGQGIAARLMRDCRDFAAKVGFERLTLEVDPKAHAALGLYQKLGFHADDPAGSGAIEMTLPLHVEG